MIILVSRGFPSPCFQMKPFRGYKHLPGVLWKVQSALHPLPGQMSAQRALPHLCLPGSHLLRSYSWGSLPNTASIWYRCPSSAIHHSTLQPGSYLSPKSDRDLFRGGTMPLFTLLAHLAQACPMAHTQDQSHPCLPGYMVHRGRQSHKNAYDQGSAWGTQKNVPWPWRKKST